jgi:hypothetical protein
LAASIVDDDEQAPFRPDSPSGWSDLPSDAEDTFFLTPEETADLHRTKRLRHFDDLRTARLRALSPSLAPDGYYGDVANADAGPPWGGSDEEVNNGLSSHIMKAMLTLSLARVFFCMCML